ncbi:MAG: hypothetical protein WCA49_14700 [Candidatus Sulfotelmatobacter sp.]
MLRLIRLIGCTLILGFSVSVILAQETTQDENPSQSLVWGFMIKGAYAPNPWRTTTFGNLPVSLRTVNYGNTPYAPTGSYTFDQSQLKLHSGALIIPVELGPAFNFGRHLELAAGGTIVFDNNLSNSMQIGCYCEGSTVTYEKFLTTPVRIGGFGEIATHVKGKTWLTAEASSSPIWSNIVLKQAFSAYNTEYVLLKQQVGNYRVPLTVLAGVKFCGDCDRENRYMYGFSAGFAYWQNHFNSEFSGVVYPHGQRFLVIQGFLEYQAIFARKKK